MNVLILHGIMGSAGENWSQWLSDSLQQKGHVVAMPNLPEADHPDRNTWLEVIQEVMNDLGDDTVIVAHSLGVTSALDFLEKHKGKIRGMASVSGFSDDYGLELNSYFMKEKMIDFGKVNDSLAKAVVIYGDNDPYVPQESLNLLAKQLSVEPIVVENGGHLNEAAGFSKFPLLLNSVLDI